MAQKVVAVVRVCDVVGIVGIDETAIPKDDAREVRERGSDKIDRLADVAGHGLGSSGLRDCKLAALGQAKQGAGFSRFLAEAMVTNAARVVKW